MTVAHPDLRRTCRRRRRPARPNPQQAADRERRQRSPYADGATGAVAWRLSWHRSDRGLDGPELVLTGRQIRIICTPVIYGQADTAQRKYSAAARLGVRGGAWSCALCWDMMSGVSPEPGVYVARYGWNGRSGGLIIGAAVFVLIALTVPMSLALRVVTLVLFGGGALVFIASIATRRVALRVDARGITLGGSPGRYRSTTRLIPWADVREVVLWRQPMPYGRSVRYVAVARHRGAPPLAGRRGRGPAR